MSVARISRALDSHEVAYLEVVSGHLDDLPADLHLELLNEAAEHLAERPRSRDITELIGPLGPPELYAETLRADHEAGPELMPAKDAPQTETETKSRPHRRRRWWFAALAILVLSAMVGGAFAYDGWVTWQAPIQMPEEGINRVGVDAARGIRFNQAGDVSEIRVQATPGDRFVAGLMFYGRTGARLTGVQLFGPSPHRLLHTTAIRMARDDLLDGPHACQPNAAATWHAFHGATVSDPRGVNLRVYFTYQPCIGTVAAETVSYSTIRLTYRARGRTRHLDLAMDEWMTFVLHPRRGPPPSTTDADADTC